jgi:hypothetical protein
VGSTGSGKSTLLLDTTRQLIAQPFGNAEEKIGLLILDSKCDDLVARVQEAALRAGRAGDVVVFGPNGDCTFDLFGGLRSLDDVERLSRQILGGMESFGRDNAFWHNSSQAMLSAAFSLLVASGQPITFTSTVEFLRAWFLSPVLPPRILELVERFNRRGGSTRPLLATALDQVPLWQSLDTRTRSNLQACLLNVLRPLLSPVAAKCFDPAAAARTASPADAATKGKICLVSVNAMFEPDLSRFIFRLAKQAFFDAVQQRTGEPHRLCGLIVDEFPLIVEESDAEQFATIRTKRCFALSASQGINSISARAGAGPTRALLNHFNTTVFFRSREMETSVLAQVAMGTFKLRPHPRHKEESGYSAVLPRPEPPAVEAQVCPIGALGLLAPHQAFLMLADGQRTESPVWFVPWFDLDQVETAVAPVVCSASPSFSSAHVERLMLQGGFKPIFSPHLVRAATEIWNPRRGDVLEGATEFFRNKACRVPAGLEQLPPCWLAALPGLLWKLRRRGWTHLPFFIDRLESSNGVLLISFAQEVSTTEKRLTSWDEIRVAVNAGLYPSRYRPLSRRHVMALAQAWPDLRSALRRDHPILS